METPVLENPVFDLEKIEVGQLPELQGLKEKQLQIVRENPFIEISDNATFDLAKKSRTNLVSARTEIQNQDKAIASKIKKFREMVSTVSAELIAITKPHEDKQQDEVKRFEAEKEAEKLEKQRIENERIGKIKAEIDSIYNSYVAKIQNLSFDLIQTLEVDFEQNLKRTDASKFEEFELDFNEKLMMLDNQFSSKKTALEEKEVQRVEAENLKAECEKLEADRKALEEKQAAENARMAKEKADSEEKLAADKKAIEDQAKAAAEKIEADRQKIENEQKDTQQKLDADRAEIEAEKAKIAQAEADKKAAELAEKEAAEKVETDRIAAEKAQKDARVKAEQQEALKPEKEKAIFYVESVQFSADAPDIKDEKINHLVNELYALIGREIKNTVQLINNL